MNQTSKFASLLEEMRETYDKKNRDYGNSFSRTVQKYGLLAAAVRMEDKLNRFQALIKNKEQCVKDESIRDTLMDLANYCLMTVLELEGGDEE